MGCLSQAPHVPRSRCITTAVSCHFARPKTGPRTGITSGLLYMIQATVARPFSLLVRGSIPEQPMKIKTHCDVRKVKSTKVWSRKGQNREQPWSPSKRIGGNNPASAHLRTRSPFHRISYPKRASKIYHTDDTIRMENSDYRSCSLLF